MNKNSSSKSEEKTLFVMSNPLPNKFINEQRLMKKYKDMQKKKFKESFTTHCRCDNVKSSGNGL